MQSIYPFNDQNFKQWPMMSSLKVPSYDDDIFGGLELESECDGEAGRDDLFLADNLQEICSDLSRTLFVSQVASHVSEGEIRDLFKTHGDIRLIHMGLKAKGLVLVAFYDSRAAQSASKALNGYTLRGCKLEIRWTPTRIESDDQGMAQGTVTLFNLDPEASNEHLRWLFQKFGDVKLVTESPTRHNQKFISFYDIRHAQAALKAMNKAEHLGKVPATSGSPKQMHGNGTYMPSSDSAEVMDMASSASLYHLAAQLEMDRKMTSLHLMDLDAAARGMHISDSASSFISNMNAHHSFGSSSSNSTRLSPSGGINSGSMTDSQSNVSDGIVESLGDLGLSAAEASLQAHKLLASGALMSGAQFGSSDSLMQGFPFANENSQVNNYKYLQSSLSLPSSHISMSTQRSPASSWNGSVVSSNNSANMYYAQAQNVHQTLTNPASLGLHDLQARQAAAQAAQQQMSLANLAGMQAQAAANFEAVQLLHAAAASQQLSNSLSGAMGSHVLNSPANAAATASLAAQLMQQAGWPLSAYMNSQLPGFSASLAAAAALERGLRDSAAEARTFGGRLTRRSFDPVLEAERKAQQEKLYSLDLGKILNGEDRRSTIMVKNIPNKYTQRMLLQTFDEFFRGMYDFFYLPIDFKNKCNVGYAFINLREPQFIVPLYKRFNNRKWERFNSEKVCSISYARIQGRAALIQHFQNSSLMHEDKRCRPILFRDEDGSPGDSEPFPMGSDASQGLPDDF